MYEKFISKKAFTSKSVESFLTLPKKNLFSSNYNVNS